MYLSEKLHKNVSSEKDNVHDNGDISKRKYCEFSNRILNNLVNSKSLKFKSSKLVAYLYIPWSSAIEYPLVFTFT